MSGGNFKNYGWDFFIASYELALPHIRASFLVPMHAVNAHKHTKKGSSLTNFEKALNVLHSHMSQVPPTKI
jgi:hypothetical protein